MPNFNSGTPATNTPAINMNAPVMTYHLYFQDPGVYYIWARGWGDASAVALRSAAATAASQYTSALTGDVYAPLRPTPT